AFPRLPWLVEKWAFPDKVPIVTDYDDAVFHLYDLHPNPLVRGLLGEKIDQVMAHSRMVFVGNEYLAERARQAGVSSIRIIPTVVDLNAYMPRTYGGVQNRA